MKTDPPSKPLLAIETSGRVGGVALLLPDGRVIGRTFSHDRPADHARQSRTSARGPEGRGARRAVSRRPAGHGRLLVPLAAELVAEAGIAKRDLGAIAVSLGPGSYTGLRVGVTAAKTLAWALSCELVGVATLEALARDAAGTSGPTVGCPEGTRRLVPAMDARRGEVYAAVFTLTVLTERVVRCVEDAAMSPAELSRLLARGDHVFGTALRCDRSALVDSLELPEGATSAAGPECPRPATIALMGAELLARGEVLAPHEAAPRYLRKSVPETRKERAERG